MNLSLDEPIPSIRQYNELLESNTFLQMEQFASGFLEEHWEALGPYRKKWVENPFKQWSRQYEYPYVYQEIVKHAKETSDTLKVLDAGSGVTFFPYYLQKEFIAKVHSVDYDETLASIYDAINGERQNQVRFDKMDIDALDFEEDSFDIIYCISVLEHTENYTEIVKGFYGKLKPGGKLILTFDISVNGEHDISIDQADDLLKDLENTFSSDLDRTVLTQVDWKNVVTTRYTYKHNRELLPFPTRHPLNWRTLAKHLIPGKNPYFFPYLSYYCCTLQKLS